MRGLSLAAAGIVLVALVGGCVRPSVSIVQQRKDAMLAIKALRGGAFKKAASEADKVVRGERGNVYGRLVRAIARYRGAMHQLSTDLPAMLAGFQARGFNERDMRSPFERVAKQLASVAQDLAAAKHQEIYLELCLACWEEDWNRNGRIDRRDRLLFQIERDADGQLIPKNDPRRRPVFRFDRGDVDWAQAFVSFQRAAIDVLLAYEWTEIVNLVFGAVAQMFGGRQSPTARIKLKHPQLMKSAREKILAGLDFADASRRAYLAEKDDDREWVPNPRQRNHPMPLPVDDKLYETWAAMIDDVRRLLDGKEGLGVAEIARLAPRQMNNLPGGYINFGKLFSDPQDIVIAMDVLMRVLNPRRPADVEAALSAIFGAAYTSQMRPSPITKRLGRMKREINRGEESLRRKLRYLLWLN